LNDLIRAGIDPVFFARKQLNFSPDDIQVSVLRKILSETYVLINCCRQWGKSTICALKALHQAVFYPEQMILLLSPSLRQSSELFRKVLDFANLIPWLQRTEDTKTSMTLTNGSRIISLPGSEHTVRGYSDVDLIIVDEAACVLDDFYYAVRPMLAVSGGSIFLLSTPWGKRGFFYHEWQRGGWHKVQVTAKQCPRIPVAFLKKEKERIPAWFYRQEYFCSFEENAAAVFDSELVERMFSSDDVVPLFRDPQRGEEGSDLLDNEIKPLEIR